MSLEAQMVQVMEEGVRQIASALVPMHVGELRQSFTAASGWCAPLDPDEQRRLRRERNAHRKREAQYLREKEIQWGMRLACGCTKDILETGWHETGCEIVGEHLCRPVTRQRPAARQSPTVVYAA